MPEFPYNSFIKSNSISNISITDNNKKITIKFTCSDGTSLLPDTTKLEVCLKCNNILKTPDSVDKKDVEIKKDINNGQVTLSCTILNCNKENIVFELKMFRYKIKEVRTVNKLKTILRRLKHGENPLDLTSKARIDVSADEEEITTCLLALGVDNGKKNSPLVLGSNGNKKNKHRTTVIEPTFDEAIKALNHLRKKASGGIFDTGVKGIVEELIIWFRTKCKAAANVAGVELTDNYLLDESSCFPTEILQNIVYGVVLLGGVTSITFGATDISKDLTKDIVFIVTGVVVLLALDYFCYYNKSRQAKVALDDPQSDHVEKSSTDDNKISLQ